MVGRRILTSFVASFALFAASTASAQMTGDHNEDGVLDAADLNLVTGHSSQ